MTACVVLRDKKVNLTLTEILGFKHFTRHNLNRSQYFCENFFTIFHILIKECNLLLIESNSDKE